MVQQIEHNLKYDFSLTSEDGHALEPLFGPGFTGLQNLGNRQVITIYSLPVLVLHENFTAATWPPSCKPYFLFLHSKRGIICYLKPTRVRAPSHFPPTASSVRCIKLLMVY